MSKSNSKSAARKKAIKELVIGGALAAVGGVASIASYNNARPGETYTVYTGVIVIGAIYAFKGLFGVVFPNGFKKPGKASDSAVVAKEPDEADVIEKAED